MKNRKHWGEFLMISTVSILYDSVLINMYFTPLIKDFLLQLKVVRVDYLVGILFVILRVTKLIFDIPIGYLADKFSVKKILYSSLVLKILGLLILLLVHEHWIPGHMWILVFSVVCKGLSIVSFRGKINVFQYNFLKHYGIARKYREINTIYTLVLSFLTVICNKISGSAYAFGNYRSVLLGSIYMLLLALLILFFVKFDTKNDRVSILKNWKIVKQNLPIVGWHLFLISFCYSAWNFNDLNGVFTNKLFNNAKITASIYDYGCKIIFFGTFINFLYVCMNVFRKRLYKKKQVQPSLYKHIVFFNILWVTTFLLTFLAKSFQFNSAYTLTGYFLYYMLLENILQTHIVTMVPKEIRNTIMSIAGVMNTILSIIMLSLFLWFTEKIGCYRAYSLIIFGICIISVIASIRIFKQKSSNPSH